MRRLLALVFLASCAPDLSLEVPSTIAFEPGWCELDPVTGEVANPNCPPPAPWAVRLDVVVDSGAGPASGQVVDVSSVHGDVVLLPRTEVAGASAALVDALDAAPGTAMPMDAERPTDYGPTFASLTADESGLASTYVWMEAPPRRDDGSPLDAAIYVHAGAAAAVVELDFTP